MLTNEELDAIEARFREPKPINNLDFMTLLTAARRLQNIENNIVKAKRLLSVYGSAIRGYWGSIDGRSVRGDLNVISAVLSGLNTKDYETLVHGFGICPKCSQWAYEICDCPKKEWEEGDPL